MTLIREGSEGRVSGHCFGILSPTSWPRGNSTLAHVSRTATPNQDLHSGAMRRSTFDRTSKAAFLLTGNNSALSNLGAPRSRENLTALALRVDYDGILIGRAEFLELKGFHDNLVHSSLAVMDFVRAKSTPWRRDEMWIGIENECVANITECELYCGSVGGL